MTNQRGSRVDGYAGNLLSDINGLLGTTTERRVTHILRESNSATYFMAVGGYKRIETEYAMGNLPSQLHNLIRLDGWSCGSERRHR